MVLDSTDYYRFMSLARTASGSEIRAAYRRLAMRLHPDMDDSAEAATAFGYLCEAYRCLSDERAREAYDKGERYARDMRDRLPDAERYWREGSQAVRHQVGESPVVVALLAGLVGLVIGWLIFHQSSDTQRDHHRR